MTDAPAVLSERQLEVARLLADGLKDWQIARRMRISVSTVEAHVKKAYRKTGTGGRARLVEWVREHDSRITKPEDAADEHNRSTDGSNRWE